MFAGSYASGQFIDATKWMTYFCSVVLLVGNSLLNYRLQVDYTAACSLLRAIDLELVDEKLSSDTSGQMIPSTKSGPDGEASLYPLEI